MMRGKAWRWVLAVVITLASAVWQRVSGPSYPVHGRVTLGGRAISLRLERSHSTASDQPVRVTTTDPWVTGEVVWRRFPSSDPWQASALQRWDDELAVLLPRQPAAGKIEYQVRLRRGAEQAVFPRRAAVTRFRDDVPAPILVPHIVAMFLAMLFATRAGIEALGGQGDPRRLSWATLAILVVGGFVLGPLVQKFAFGEWWTGVPFGWDLTDNKTLLAGLAWAFAVWTMRGGRAARGAVIAAAVITLVVFTIPHTAWGSQLDWSKLPQPAATAPLR